MKIIIEAEAKEIAALVKELEGQLKTELYMDANGSITSISGGSVITATEDAKISDSTIMEINKSLGELAAVSARGCY